MSTSGLTPRPLRFGDSQVCIRPDLQVVAIRRGLGTRYVLKDPVNLKYYEFDEHELGLIQRLDGTSTWDEICTWYNQRFPPLRLTHQSLQALLWRLYKQGLLLTVAPGQGQRIAERAAKLWRSKLFDSISKPWVIRLPGFNPGRSLQTLSVLFSWIFSAPFVCAATTCLLILLSLVIARFHAIADASAQTAQSLTAENLPMLGFAIVVTKILHELGHAIAAARRNCECHEMGVLLLAGLPSLYCDVSDAWTLKSRWQRICISLAGIWVELLVAAFAFVVWMTSVPGIVHVISFDIMAVCSIGTVLFNANPLVRYDGYYVLMDLTGVSNLGQRSQEALHRLSSRWIFGTAELRPFDAPDVPVWCLFYGIAAGIYRVVLFCAILWGLHLILKPYYLDGAVWTMAAIGMVIWAGQTSRRLTRTIRTTVSSGTPKWRVLSGCAFLAVCAYLILSTPISWYVLGDAVLEPSNGSTVVVSVPGRLITAKKSGTAANAGDVIATLENLDFQSELKRLDSELTFQREHLETLLARRHNDTRAADQIPHTRASIDSLKHRMDHLLEEQRRLTLHAREQATVYPAPIRLEKYDADELSNWTGSLLDPINADAWAVTSDPICQVGSADHLEAIAVLAQDELDAVAAGQQAEILLKSTGTRIQGEVERISSLYIDSKSETTAAATLPRVSVQGSHSKIRGNWYEVRIRCTSTAPAGTRIRSRGKVRIHVGSRTIGNWIATQFFKTFRWHS